MKNRYFTAFTLAEMMVVLLVASVILACMAPSITTRLKADQNSALSNSSPWQWTADNRGDTFLRANTNGQSVIIGQQQKTGADDAKLIINATGDAVRDMALFKHNDNVLGRLRFENNGILLGTQQTNGALQTSSMALGSQTIARNEGALAIGTRAEAHNVGAIAIGSRSRNTQAANSTLNAPAAVGDYSVAIGVNSSTASQGSVAIGLSATTSGGSYGATAIGYGARTQDRASLAIGYNAIVSSNTNTTNGAIAIGNSSSSSNEAAVGIGYTDASGPYSIAISSSYNSNHGADTPNRTTSSGTRSIAIGTSASASGDNSIAIGSGATTSAIYDIAIGNDAKVNNKMYMGYNIAIGKEAMVNSNGNFYNNIAIGQEALKAITNTSNNVAVGYRAMMYNNTGSDNVAVGVLALRDNVSGNNNVAIGEYACDTVKGSNKTCLGYNSGPKSNDEFAKAGNTDKVVFLGNSDTTVYIPGNLVVGKRAFIGASLGDTGQGTRNCLFYNSERGWHGVFGYKGDGDRDSWGVDMNELNKYHGVWADKPSYGLDFKDFGIISSDRRLKFVGKTNEDGLAKIKQLKIFNYTYKKDDTKTPHVGVIAQDLQKIFPNAVKKAADGFLTIRMEDMFYAAINAIKELDARVTALEKENKILKEQNKALDARLKALEAKIK